MRAAKDALGKDVTFVGKTGSTKDGWFVGYTPNLVCVVWVGFDEGDKDIGLTGGEIALPIWTDFMRSATQSRPEYGGKAFPMPKGLIQVTIDPETGMVADRFCPQRQKVVIPTNAFSNIVCLRHQPKPEMLYSEYDYEESAPIISAESYEISEETADENNSSAGETYKSINGVPVVIDNQKNETERENKSEKTIPNLEKDLNRLGKSHRIGGRVEN